MKYNFVFVNQFGAEAQLMVNRLKDAVLLPNLEHDLVVNNPLIKNMNKNLTYFGRFKNQLKDGIHLLYDDRTLIDFCYFNNGLVDITPHDYLPFLYLYQSDFKAFDELIQNNKHLAHLTTPWPLYRFKKGYVYSLLEETIMFSDDFKFMESVLMCLPDIHTNHLKHPESQYVRTHDPIAICIDKDKLVFVNLLLSYFPHAYTSKHADMMAVNLIKHEFLSLQAYQINDAVRAYI